MLGFEHATAFTTCQRRIRVPRAQSGGGSGTYLQKGEGLRGLRGGHRASQGPVADAGFGVVRHAHALALCPLAARRRRSIGVHAMVDGHAYPTLARGALDLWNGRAYQGRFKSFPIQEDDHLFTVLRYVERNPLRANLVQDAVAWRWSSLWHRVHGGDSGLVDDGPLPMSSDWLHHVQTPQSEGELEALRRSVARRRTVWRERLGRNERPSDSAWSPRFALGVVNRRQRPRRHCRRAKTPDPFEFP